MRSRSLRLLLSVLSIPVSVCFGQTLDPTFDTDGKVLTPLTSGSNSIYDMVLQPDGKIVAVGYANNGTDYDMAIARYNIDGSLDMTFNSIGYDLVNFGVQDDIAYSVALQSDGKIVVSGSTTNASNNTDFVLLRYNTNGTLDLSFDTDGRVITTFGSSYETAYAVAIQSDGKIIAAGNSFSDTTFHFAMARYKSDGSLDASFGSGGKVTTLLNNSDQANAIKIQPDGKIILAGTTLQPDFNNAFGVARYNTDGSLDLTFSSDGMVTTSVSPYSDYGQAMDLQADGKIVVAGKATPVGPEQFAVVRYNTDGSLDNSWNGTGMVTTAFGSNWDEARSVTVRADGRILAGGLASVPSQKFAMACYNTDGTLYTGFGTGGKMTTTFGSSASIWSLIIQPDDKIVAGGFSGGGTHYDFAIARYGPADSGIDEFDAVSNSLTVYPSPAKQTINVSYTLADASSISIDLMGFDGKVIASYVSNEHLEAGAHNHQFQLPENLANGVYFIHVSSADGATSVKIVKE